MTSALGTISKPFEPGTTGWTASDLDDPAIEREWFKGRYEIVEGVLTKMPPAYFAGGAALLNLIFAVREHVGIHGPKGSFATEVDIIIDEQRVAVSDAAFLTDEQRKLQDAASRRAGKADVRRTRMLVPPMLIIESVSPGHEQHDRKTKVRWYAEFGVTNYWIIDAFARRLECFALQGQTYRMDQSAGAAESVQPSAFSGLTIRLNDLWRE